MDIFINSSGREWIGVSEQGIEMIKILKKMFLF